VGFDVIVCGGLVFVGKAGIGEGKVIFVGLLLI